MKVRTTMQPDVEIEVGEAEHLDLQREGLLAEGPASQAKPTKAQAPAPTTDKEK